MPDLGIAHLIVGQARILPGCRQQAVCVVLQQRCVVGKLGERQRIGFGVVVDPPAIKNDERNRFGPGLGKRLRIHVGLILNRE